MTRTEILNVINEIVEEEHGKVLTEENLLTDSELDSFGYAMLWLGLIAKIQDKTGIEVLTKEELRSITYEGLTVEKLLTNIEKKMS